MKTSRYIAAVGLMVLVPVASAPAAAQPDCLTPGDAELVVTINIRQVLQAPVVKKHALASLKKLLQDNKEIRQILDAAAIDPLQDLDTLTVAGSAAGQAVGKLVTPSFKTLLVARGRFDSDKTRRAAEDYAKKHPEQLQPLTEGNLSMWKVPTPIGNFYAVFTDQRTLVMAGSKEEASAAVRRAAQGPQPLNKDLRAALDKVNGQAPLWMALAVTDKLRELLKGDDNFKDFLAGLQALTGSLELNENVQATLIYHTNSPQAAKKVKGRLDEMMRLLAILDFGKDQSSQIVKEVIDSIKLKTEKNDASICVQITDDQIEKARKKER